MQDDKPSHTQSINNHVIHGLAVTPKTGCLHYHSPLDIVAIKFKCCGKYYSCYSCHQALAEHEVQRWKHDDLHKLAILCGGCGTEMSIHEYVSSKNECVKCGSHFNPKCKSHWNLYFEQSCFVL